MKIPLPWIYILPTILHFLVAPQIFHFDFGDEAINSGDMVSVSCSISKGDLPLNITWRFNGLPIHRLYGISVNLVNQRLSALSIESVGADHAGKYTCVAQNAAGSTSYSAYLNVNGI